MNRPKTPYSLQIALAIAAGNKQNTHDLIGNVIEKLCNDVAEFVKGYDYTDLPFVLAAMEIIANGVMPTLGEDGLGIVKTLVGNTHTTTINLSALQKLTEKDDRA